MYGVMVVPQRAERGVQPTQSTLPPGQPLEQVAVDPSPAGAQPMGPVGPHVIHNGEAEAHHGLGGESADKGRAFSTSIDREVTLAAYRHWGEDANTAVADPAADGARVSPATLIASVEGVGA